MTDFSFSSTAEEVTEGLSLEGSSIVITGINSGIGRESARVLALRGAHIIGAARTVEKAQDTLDALKIKGTAIACELSEPTSVRAAVKSILGLDQKLDVILCNAGIMALPERQERQGLELQFLTNHIGHFIFVTGLQGALTEAGRVVMVSSGAHRMAPEMGIDFEDLDGKQRYDPWANYGQSKLANILFARSLQQRFEGTSKVASSLHPGVIQTNLGRNDPEGIKTFFENADPATIKTIPQGAATQCLLAARPDAKDAAGRYYSDCKPAKASKLAKDDALAEKLWKTTEALVEKLK